MKIQLKNAITGQEGEREVLDGTTAGNLIETLRKEMAGRDDGLLLHLVDVGCDSHSELVGESLVEGGKYKLIGSGLAA